MAETTVPVKEEVKLTPNAASVLKHSSDINAEIELQKNKAAFNPKHTYADSPKKVVTEVKKEEAKK